MNQKNSQLKFTIQDSCKKYYDKCRGLKTLRNYPQDQIQFCEGSQKSGLFKSNLNLSLTRILKTMLYLARGEAYFLFYFFLFLNPKKMQVQITLH